MNQQPNSIIGLGLMSGTSLDGLDLALCHFPKTAEKWNYRVLRCETVGFETTLQQQLAHADQLSGLELMQLDRTFAHWIAQTVRQFLEKCPEKPDFIASHGQTIFHQPQNGLTVQIGNGAIIAAETGITTVCDFRTTDVALGGQGAPLVPIGDQLLYNQYDACLNLGGFCNISFEENNCRRAFDVAPCNLLINHLAQQLGHRFDRNGALAREGFSYRPLLTNLNNLEFYQQTGAKSLGKEWLDTELLPLLSASTVPVIDQLRTATEHIAVQIAHVLNTHSIQSVLVTGGGAKNAFLMDCIRTRAPQTTVVIPDDATIDFKEAIIFAFLGLLRLQNQDNCLQSVTGARYNSCGGAVYLGKCSTIL